MRQPATSSAQVRYSCRSMGGGNGRSRTGRRLLRGAVVLLATLLVAAPGASARVTLVATGTPELVFLGIPRNEVVARLALPATARAVAVTRDGTRAYVSAGPEVVAVDVNQRMESGRSALGAGPEISDVELSPGGETLYAVRGTQLVALDAQTLIQRTAIELRGPGGALAVANDGSLAAVTLASGRVAMIGLGTSTLLRHVRLKGVLGVAIADSGVTYATARGRLRLISPGQHRPDKRPRIKLPAGAGGMLTLSPGRSRLVVAAVAGGRAAA
ncbi:MAG: YncE family protein, partial [Solirubrobacteraceae bacterium]